MKDNNNCKLKLLVKWVLIFCLALSIPGMAFAKDKEDNTEKEFRKTPEIHGSGMIDRVESKLIVIDDRQFPLAENYVKRSSEDESISSVTLKKGMNVAYELNKKKEIVTVWIIKGKE